MGKSMSKCPYRKQAGLDITLPKVNTKDDTNVTVRSSSKAVHTERNDGEAVNLVINNYPTAIHGDMALRVIDLERRLYSVETALLAERSKQQSISTNKNQVCYRGKR